MVFGGSGRTGMVLCEVLRQRGCAFIAPSHAECDLADSIAVSDFVLGCGSSLVINAAAVSSLERCAEDPLTAHLVNAVSPAAMALACRHTGARFVHLSTDYVLDGRRPVQHGEGAKCRPCSVYAESKREGELQVAEALPSALIARVSWICDNPQRPGFVESVVTKARVGLSLAAVADKFSMPTSAEDIARVLLSPQLESYQGVLHLCSAGEPVSWWQMALWALEEAAAVGALSAVPPVEAQSLDRVPFFREPRPRHTAMSCARLLSLGVTMPTAEETVRRAVRRMLAAG